MRAIEQIPQLPVHTARSGQQYLVDGLLGAGEALAVTGIIYGYHLYPTIPNISVVYLLDVSVATPYHPSLPIDRNFCITQLDA